MQMISLLYDYDSVSSFNFINREQSIAQVLIRLLFLRFIVTCNCLLTPIRYIVRMRTVNFVKFSDGGLDLDENSESRLELMAICEMQAQAHSLLSTNGGSTFRPIT